ncbi:hypothetical protein JW911_00340 [Candidatus Peregrinibacteria bacterium]|nr:hypothetical protein [Candidatus Peregrinibacteria bacterium]
MLPIYERAEIAEEIVEQIKIAQRFEKNPLRHDFIAIKRIQKQITQKAKEIGTYQKCIQCPEKCCTKGAEQFLDETYFVYLFLHASPSVKFDVQRALRREHDELCRFVTPSGCMLPKIFMPAPCKAFFCPEMGGLNGNRSYLTQQGQSLNMRFYELGRRLRVAELL